jgi:hypothetical protein
MSILFAGKPAPLRRHAGGVLLGIMLYQGRAAAAIKT